PTAAALAQAGYQVVGVDVKSEVVEAVNSGLSHIVEPGLDDLLAETVRSGALSAVAAAPVADVYLIAVPTPTGDDEYHTPDLGCVFAAAASIAPVLRPGALVVLESTSPVGATRLMIER